MSETGERPVPGASRGRVGRKGIRDRMGIADQLGSMEHRAGRAIRARPDRREIRCRGHAAILAILGRQDPRVRQGQRVRKDTGGKYAVTRAQDGSISARVLSLATGGDEALRPHQTGRNTGGQPCSDGYPPEFSWVAQ